MAASARVTVIDNLPRQHARDREVAAREELTMTDVEGDMADLSMFADGSFDLVYNPMSNVFAPDVRPIWRDAYRVLRKGGALFAAFDNPIVYMVDEEEWERSGKLVVKYAVPTSDAERLSEANKRRYREEGFPLEFGHTLEAQIGGQCEAGFVLTGMYEDGDRPGEKRPLAGLTPLFIVTSAVKG